MASLSIDIVIYADRPLIYADRPLKTKGDRHVLTQSLGASAIDRRALRAVFNGHRRRTETAPEECACSDRERNSRVARGARSAAAANPGSAARVAADETTVAAARCRGATHPGSAATDQVHGGGGAAENG